MARVGGVRVLRCFFRVQKRVFQSTSSRYRVSDIIKMKNLKKSCTFEHFREHSQQNIKHIVR